LSHFRDFLHVCIFFGLLWLPAGNSALLYRFADSAVEILLEPSRRPVNGDSRKNAEKTTCESHYLRSTDRGMAQLALR
jgi:hypothetical protein